MDLSWASLVIPLLLFIILIIHYEWFFAATSSKTQKKLPQSPRKLPIIGNLHQLGSLPHRSLHKLSKKHGPVMLLRFGSKPVLVVSSVEAARDIMKTHDIVFSERPKSSMANRLMYGFKDVGFAPYGEYWRQVRSVTVLHLLSNKRVQSFRDVRREEISIMIDEIRQSCDSSVINLRDHLSSLTNNIISRVALGRKYSNKGGEMKAVLDEFGELLGVFNVGDYVPWLGWVSKINGLDRRAEKVVKELDAFLESVIEEHINIKKNKLGDQPNVVSEAKDFVEVLLEIQNTKERGFTLERDSLKAIVMDSFFAGTDTILTALEWTMIEVLRNPKVMKYLENEVRQLAQEKQEITEDDLKNMTYLKAVIKESFRLHPPGPLLVPRESREDVKILDYHISAATEVLINAWAMGRDPSLWENPEEFMPERFLNSDIDYNGLHFELIPFGAGRRGCPGINFSIAVIEIALARLLHEFDFALPQGVTVENFDMTEDPGLAVRRKLPLLVVATPYSGQ